VSWRRSADGNSRGDSRRPTATALTALAIALSGAMPVAGRAGGPSGAAPYVRVLGTAQDGGIPQVGGRFAPDEAARRDPAKRRLVASLLVVDPASGKRWLIDATPDVRDQLERAADDPPGRDPGHRPLLDGVFLTHAHMGHYLGLAQFGREGLGADHLPTYGSARMVEFLGKNAPWELAVRLGHLEPRTLEPGRAVELAPGLTLTPILVPHRAEYTDTFGFVVRGPRRALLYVPDIDKWERWSERIEDRIAQVDVALLDGTFFADGELGAGRSMAEIPHPFIAESLARFAALPAAERSKIVFTHLNHSNPAALDGSRERAAVEAAGMHVAGESQRIDL
jgi:pyrroloquinoline quinone biosynthesis protein B